MTAKIFIAAVAITNSANQMLLVRKRGTSIFMQPGGKIDAGETPLQALKRELTEELGVWVSDDDLEYIGVFDAPAANEPDTQVQAELFAYRSVPSSLVAAIEPAAEIEEVLWHPNASMSAVPLAPLTRDHVMPALGV